MAFANQSVAAAPASMAFADAQRAFMTRVYFWMFVGLGVTGAAAFLTAATPQVASAVAQWWWALVVAEFALVIALSFLATRLSAGVAALLFLVYSAVNGLTLSGIFYAYKLGTIGDAFATDFLRLLQ